MCRILTLFLVIGSVCCEHLFASLTTPSAKRGLWLSAAEEKEIAGLDAQYDGAVAAKAERVQEKLKTEITQFWEKVQDREAPVAMVIVLEGGADPVMAQVTTSFMSVPPDVRVPILATRPLVASIFQLREELRKEGLTSEAAEKAYEVAKEEPLKSNDDRAQFAKLKKMAQARFRWEVVRAAEALQSYQVYRLKKEYWEKRKAELRDLEATWKAEVNKGWSVELQGKWLQAKKTAGAFGENPAFYVLIPDKIERWMLRDRFADALPFDHLELVEKDAIIQSPPTAGRLTSPEVLEFFHTKRAGNEAPKAQSVGGVRATVRRPWNMLLMGHGSAGVDRWTGEAGMIGGLSGDTFSDLLNLFNELLDVRYVFLFTCYAAGHFTPKQLPVSAEMISGVEKMPESVPVGLPHLQRLHYSVVFFGGDFAPTSILFAREPFVRALLSEQLGRTKILDIPVLPEERNIFKDIFVLPPGGRSLLPLRRNEVVITETMALHRTQPLKFSAGRCINAGTESAQNNEWWRIILQTDIVPFMLDLEGCNIHKLVLVPVAGDKSGAASQVFVLHEIKFPGAYAEFEEMVQRCFTGLGGIIPWPRGNSVTFFIKTLRCVDRAWQDVLISSATSMNKYTRDQMLEDVAKKTKILEARLGGGGQQLTAVLQRRTPIGLLHDQLSILSAVAAQML